MPSSSPSGRRRPGGCLVEHRRGRRPPAGNHRTAAMKVLAAAVELFGEQDDTGGLAWCAGTEALIRVLQGRLADGRATARALIPLAESLRNLGRRHVPHDRRARRRGAGRRSVRPAGSRPCRPSDDRERLRLALRSRSSPAPRRSATAGNPAEALARFESALGGRRRR